MQTNNNNQDRLQKKRKENKKYYGPTSYSPNYFARWNPYEDEIILNKETSDTELAYELGRSIASIQKRRWYLKKNIKRNN